MKLPKNYFLIDFDTYKTHVHCKNISKLDVIKHILIWVVSEFIELWNNHDWRWLWLAKETIPMYKETIENFSAMDAKKIEEYWESEENRSFRESHMSSED